MAQLEPTVPDYGLGLRMTAGKTWQNYMHHTLLIAGPLANKYMYVYIQTHIVDSGASTNCWYSYNCTFALHWPPVECPIAYNATVWPSNNNLIVVDTHARCHASVPRVCCTHAHTATHSHANQGTSATYMRVLVHATTLTPGHLDTQTCIW